MLQALTKEKIITRPFLFDPLLVHHELNLPVDWAKEFGSDGELEVEIGSGTGEFIVQIALKHPEKRYLGIEFDQKRVQKILSRVVLAGCENIRLLTVDAHVVFEQFLIPSSIARVYCLFPDPWPKRRHIKQRLLSSDFFRLVNNRLVNGGEFKIVTDFRPYVEWIISQIERTGFRMEVKTVPARYDTKFERKWRQKGQNEFIELSLRKEKHVSIPVKRTIPMKTFCISHFDPENFSLSNVAGKSPIIFKELLFDPKKKKALVRLIITEGKFIQNIWVAIIYKRNAWSIQLAQGCPCLFTEGVNRALELVHQAAKHSSPSKRIQKKGRKPSAEFQRTLPT